MKSLDLDPDPEFSNDLDPDPDPAKPTRNPVENIPSYERQKILKNVWIKKKSTLYANLRNLANKVDFLNPNIPKTFLLGVRGFVFHIGKRRCPFSRISDKLPSFPRNI